MAPGQIDGADGRRRGASQPIWALTGPRPGDGGIDLRPAFSHVRGWNILRSLGVSMPWTRLQKMLVAAIILLACACASEAISKALGPEYPDSLPDVDPQQLIIGQSYAAPQSID